LDELVVKREKQLSEKRHDNLPNAKTAYKIISLANKKDAGMKKKYRCFDVNMEETVRQKRPRVRARPMHLLW
jgi:hypothetical protein